MKAPLCTKIVATIFSVSLLASCSKEPVAGIGNTGGVANVQTAAEGNASLVASLFTYPTETQPTVYQKVTEPVSSLCGGYWRGLPVSYNSNNLKYPLLLNFTGKSQMGSGSQTDLDKQQGPIHWDLVAGNFPSNFVVDGKNYSFIIIGPQFSSRPNPDQINEVVSYMVAHYRIDQSRIYMTGHSQGGGSCWDYGGKYPRKVAAIAPVCGSADFSYMVSKVIASGGLHVWAFHNNYDPTVDPEKTKQFVGAIQKFSPDPTLAKMTIWNYPGAGHNAWTFAYNYNYREAGKNVFEWMLQYKR